MSLPYRGLDPEYRHKTLEELKTLLDSLAILNEGESWADLKANRMFYMIDIAALISEKEYEQYCKEHGITERYLSAEECLKIYNDRITILEGK